MTAPPPFSFDSPESRAPWPRAYYALALVNVATLAAALLLAVRLVSTYADSVRTGQAWDARRDRFAELSALAFAVDAPANDVFGAGDIERQQAALSAAVPPFRVAVTALETEFRDIVRGPESGPFLQALTAIDTAARSMEQNASAVFMELKAGRRDRAAATMAAMDRDFARLSAVIRRAQYELTVVRQAQATAELKHARALRFGVQLVAVAALLTIVGLAAYGLRLGRAATRAAAEQAEHLSALRQSEARYRVLNAALSDAERRAEAARDSAEIASRLKSAFLANISHELRTPLNGVLGMLQLVTETEITDAQREYLETATGSGESLLAIINDLLDFSALEAGHLSLDAVDFRLRDSVARALARQIRRGRDKGLAVTVDISPDVPDALHGDTARLQRVLVNLFDNAVKFTPDGSVTLRMTLEERTANDVTLHVSIRDTGVGIPREQQQFVFEPFRQADSSTTRTFGGTGLGLSISAALVKLMGGRIWLESAPGVGSTFHFTVHLDVVDATTPGQGLPRISSASLARLRVLVAEDNPVNQKVAVSLLERDGHDVTVVSNGREAVDMVTREDFDVVLMDVQMPEMSGIDATMMIRDWEKRIGGHVVIIAVTARAMEGDRDACIAAGMDGYLSKPVRADELNLTIRRLIRKRNTPGAGSRAIVHEPAHVTVPGANAPPVDEVFNELELLRIVSGDESLVTELAGLFLQDAPKRVDAMRKAIGEGNARELHAAAHGLKGSATTLTARRLAQRAYTLESMAAAGTLAGAQDALAAVEREMADLTERLNARAGALNASLAE
ncbi:MAG TPA: ATP-binding protein [Gemmatimonadaceae bacterium]|nr:ATP-binding protein [Gemmatimonadaceae bacterium]